MGSSVGILEDYKKKNNLEISRCIMIDQTNVIESELVDHFWFIYSY